MFHWQTCIPHLLWPGTINERFVFKCSNYLTDNTGQYNLVSIRPVKVANMLRCLEWRDSIVVQWFVHQGPQA